MWCNKKLWNYIKKYPSIELSLWDVHKNKLVQSDSQTNASYEWIILVNFAVISLGIVFSEAFFKTFLFKRAYYTKGKCGMPQSQLQDVTILCMNLVTFSWFTPFISKYVAGISMTGCGWVLCTPGYRREVREQRGSLPPTSKATCWNTWKHTGLQSLLSGLTASNSMICQKQGENLNKWRAIIQIRKTTWYQTSIVRPLTDCKRRSQCCLFWQKPSILRLFDWHVNQPVIHAI